jgi:hypothetical protein
MKERPPISTERNPLASMETPLHTANLRYGCKPRSDAQDTAHCPTLMRTEVPYAQQLLSHKIFRTRCKSNEIRSYAPGKARMHETRTGWEWYHRKPNSVIHDRRPTDRLNHRKRARHLTRSLIYGDLHTVLSPPRQIPLCPTFGVNACSRTSQ